MPKYLQPRFFLTTLVAVFFIFALIGMYFSMPPTDFPSKETVTIKKGYSLSQAARIFSEKGIVRSPLLLKVYVMFLSGHRQAQAGDYLFTAPESAFRVAYRLVYGIQGLPKIKLIFYEGMTVKDIGNSLKKTIPTFDLPSFLALAKPHEGYLFPDTYYFYENSTPEEVVELMRQTFNERTKPLLLEIQVFGKSASDVVAMASIVEKEATSSQDRRIIAGILWKRISLGMALQVDPPFYYILNKDSGELTVKDLAVDSPYNLYKHTGLPPTPIDNPGFEALRDTVNPILTKYLFYLSGKDGRMHYATDLDGHVANKKKYLR